MRGRKRKLPSNFVPAAWISSSDDEGPPVHRGRPAQQHQEAGQLPEVRHAQEVLRPRNNDDIFIEIGNDEFFQEDVVQPPDQQGQQPVVSHQQHQRGQQPGARQHEPDRRGEQPGALQQVDDRRGDQAGALQQEDDQRGEHPAARQQPEGEGQDLGVRQQPEHEGQDLAQPEHDDEEEQVEEELGKTILVVHEKCFFMNMLPKAPYTCYRKFACFGQVILEIFSYYLANKYANHHALVKLL